MRWEHVFESGETMRDELYGRIGDRLIVAGATGVSALHLDDGELCWELPHPAALHRAPRVLGDDVLLAFADRAWYRISAREGTVCEEGRVRSDAELSELEEPTRPMREEGDDRICYGGAYQPSL